MENNYHRIVIIGNGFDLALGLKTSYADFILYHLRESIINKLMDQEANDGLVTVKIGLSPFTNRDTYIENISEYKSVNELLSRTNDDLSIEYKYPFLEELVKNYNDANWVDIENFYYEKLKFEFRNYKQSYGDEGLGEIIALNQCIDKITIALNVFLSVQQDSISINYLDSPMSSLIDKIAEPLRPEYARLVKRHNRTNPPDEIIFLNFNYTNTVFKLINSSFNKSSSRHISIHGTVFDPSNPMIFGYGDDTGDEYKELERDGENEILRKIKSFQYPRTHNYHNLLNYLESNDFDVFIIGHSCGLSDRTLLKTIFEHRKCLAIQKFNFQGEQEDFNKRMEISRHFSDKILMRERVLPYDEFAVIPQAK